MWSPGDLSPEGLIEAASELGQLRIQQAELSQEWTKVFNEGVINAHKDNAEFNETMLKTYGVQYVMQTDPALHTRLVECEGRIEAIVSTAGVLRAVTGATQFAQSSGLNRLLTPAGVQIGS